MGNDGNKRGFFWLKHDDDEAALRFIPMNIRKQKSTQKQLSQNWSS